MKSETHSSPLALGFSDILSRAITAKSSWTGAQEEFLDVIYWGRQFLGLFLGLIWGLIPLYGILGLALFALLNFGIVYFYFAGFQGIDEEEYGGVWELTKEGFATSFAGFLVVWIIIYTGLNFD
ncbi:GEL complex subunit OPTI [Lepeophtheirus salmonis]|nr:respirasome Complex Assembly Factor 1-like isoform X2 [Lepeophtheirus salmonis]XP_040567178.1 respirasome Complex Assembly Factor 1-like isoform X2 [Lepeophtheirus salmonis]ACO12481.1 C20orf24 homolog [Lepeophtheirus salmonis]